MPTPILVTGSHRSGSTWVGKVIARAPNVHYLSEPFNPVNSPGVCNLDRSHWFLYITADNEAQHAPAIDRMLRFSYDTFAQLKHAPTPSGIRQLAGEWRQFSMARSRGERPLVKDPIAIFSAPWLSHYFKMQVIALIRHPAAFVTSLKRVNWQFDYKNFVAQPALMRDLMQPFDGEIRQYAANKPSLVDAAILQWRVIHHALATFEEQHKDWIFARHEDLSSEPIAQFERIYKFLGLDFSSDVRGWLEETTKPGNAVEAEGAVLHQLVRDSRATVKSWKKRFTEAELLALRNAVEPISSRWYHDADW